MRKFILSLCILWNVSEGAALKPPFTTLPVFSYGTVDAPLEVIEFSSMYCPACEHFQRTTFRDIEQHYISSGQVQWTRIPFALDFGDVLMLTYMKHLPKDQLWKAYEWYKSFRETSTFKHEDDLHEQLIVSLKEKYLLPKEMQKVIPEEIDMIVQETLRLVEQYKLKDYPMLLINGQSVSVSRVKEFIRNELKQLQRQ